MNKLNEKMMHTPDLNAERLETLKKLFPDLFTLEGKLNPDELKKIIDPDLVKESERYEFRWFGKSGAKRNAFTPSKATFIYDEQRSVQPEDADGNMIIEGENLEALKCLLSGYREQVKCIYIDPPYNTGNDFVYSDNWDENKQDYWQHIGVVNGDGVKLESNPEDSGRYHSNWMNMIYPRLLLARQLLREDGVIFISIDDNEVHHLRKICDEVFGAENFVANFTIKSNPRGSQASRLIAVEHEHIIAYSKNYEKLEIIGYKKSSDEVSDYSLNNENGKYRLLGLRQRGGAWRKEDRPLMYYPIFVNPENGEVSLEKNSICTKKALPKRPSGEESRWTWGKTKFEKDKHLLVGKNVSRRGEEDFWDVFRKDYMLSSDGEIARKKPRSVWDEKEMNYQNGRNQIRDLFRNSELFDFPKPAFIIQKCIGMLKNSNDIILDFFAGSGTTAHAVTQLNQEDGGNRKYILVQIPEATDPKSEAYKAGYKKISDITIERNKRVIEQLKEKEEKEKQPELLGDDKKPFKTGFKVYTLAKSNFPRIEFAPDPTKTEEDNLKLLDNYIEEKEAMFLSMIDEKNIFDEVLLKNGFMLNYSKEQVASFKNNQVFRINDNYKGCLICMDMSIEKETLKELENHKDSLFICLERSLDTTMKWNLKHLLGDKLIGV